MARKATGPRKPERGGKNGRPTLLLEPTCQTAILDAIRAGASLRDAAEAAGIGYSTLKSWRAQGRKDLKAGNDTEFSAFLAATKKAAAEFVTINVKAIQEHGNRSWQARAWLLERRRPELFSDQRQEVRRLSRQVEQLLVELAAVKSQTQHDPATAETPAPVPAG
jgi:transposase-like protein